MFYKESLSRRAYLVFNFAFLTLLGISTLFPMVNTLAVSFSSAAAAAKGGIVFWPKDFTIAAYNYAIKQTALFQSLVISVERIFLGGAINMFLTITAAYPLAHDKSKFKYRTAYSWFFVFTMLVSGGMIPTFILISNLHLLNTIWALVLPGAVPVFNLILLINFFRNVPYELEEAAISDGANHWTILWRIYVPVSMPAIATLVLFVIVAHWNSWFDGLLYMNDPSRYPLQSYLQTVIINSLNATTMTMEQIKEMSVLSNRTVKASQVIIGTIPILVFYPFLQRYFVTGITLGGIKG